MTIEVSEDGKSFNEVWKADKLKGDWTIGLDGKGTFQLFQRVLFGE